MPGVLSNTPFGAYVLVLQIGKEETLQHSSGQDRTVACR